MAQMEPELHVGDVREVLPRMEAGSVQCVVTSPPYWGLRDYGVEGQIGLEPTLDGYVETMVEVFREVRRVLADDGVCWLNLGDSYGSGAIGGSKVGANNTLQTSSPSGYHTRPKTAHLQARPRPRPKGVKPKDLCLIPARVALALQADGWYVRSEIIWAKGVSFRPEWSGSVMPESVKDRPTRAHETVWLLSKSARYFYDAEVVREEWADHRKGAAGGKNDRRLERIRGDQRRPQLAPLTSGRNLRDVWTIGTKPYKGAHFATFPPALVEPMIKAGSRVGDRVLDPFAGSGTVGEVALRMGRQPVLVELNEDYAVMSLLRMSEVTQDAHPVQETPQETPQAQSPQEAPHPQAPTT